MQMFCMSQGLCSYYSYHLDISFYFIGWEAGYTDEKNEVGPYFYSIHTNQLNMDSRVKCKTPNFKLLAENIGNNLDTDLGNEFF